jgi:hypothetical protein
MPVRELFNFEQTTPADPPYHRVMPSKPSISACLSVGLAALLFGVTPAVAQTLGAASSFAIEATAGVTAAGGAGTVVTGDVGTSPSASITGFPPAIVTPPYGLHPNDTAAINARAAVTALYTELGNGVCTSAPGGQMAAINFGPGIHCFTSTADLAASSSMSLTGAGLYIFRVPTALTANVLSTVALAGVDPCNVFWQVGSAATLNGVNFPGTVVAQSGVTLGVGAALTGRALVTAGPVTLSGTNSIQGCATSVPTLSEWAVVGLSVALAAAGFVALRRRRTRLA